VAAGWYGDGGVRLNAPLAPSLALGADRVVVIGLNSSVSPAEALAQPDAIDGIAQLLQVALSDQLADGVATLAAINERLAPPGSSPGGAGASGRRHRRIPYIASRSAASRARSTTVTTPGSPASCATPTSRC
jgi:NTE family protein